MKVLVGSTALCKYVNLNRTPEDIDYFGVGDENEPGVEYFHHPALSYWFGNEERDATLDELYTIKISHIFWDLNNNTWEKHCHDIIAMEKAGAVLKEDLYQILYKVWEQRYGKKKANLNAEPSDFFNKKVHRIYDHDSIHASIAYNEKPMFEQILRDGHAVAVDKNKWNNLSLRDKFQCVREEVYATALERQLIPSNYMASSRLAYKWALKKTITSFSKGWFPLFIVTHLNELWRPDCDYVARHKHNSDRLILLKGEV